MDRLRGTVTAFDPHRGLGTVTSPGGTRWPFHCVSLTDGTRSVEVGTQVEFSVAFRVLRLEAVDVAKLLD